ncbi:MAG TPA: bifunctional alpha/beta hydrolase/OsmC family protein [Casimicrobiaceae bacterium]|nr:bifunctional alpha/beta hydrolase/OsmC family protein [Casimicrobiaceae bacterium]
MSRTSTAVCFPGAGGDKLAARLDLPSAAEPHAYALFAHCFTCSKESKAATFIAEALADTGIAVLRFDFTGLGGSEGDFANTSFSSNIGDLVAAADRLRRDHRAPAILVGHSLGGAAALAAAARIPEAVAVATINAPADPAHVTRLFAAQRAEIDARGKAEVQLAGRTFTIRREFLEDVAAQKLTAAIAGLRRSLLVFHAPRDSTVGIDNASAIFQAAKHPKSFISLDDADHLLTRRADSHYVGAVLAAWASRYLPAIESGAPLSPRDTVIVQETHASKFQQSIVIGPHRLIVDEPVSAGGEDSGPSPYDLLASALGACTAMTLRTYADLKRIPLERVQVALRHAKIHASDCAECETRQAKIDRIERVITLEGELDEAARAKLLDIANRCPVHRTLHGEVNVTTRLADGAA